MSLSDGCRGQRWLPSSADGRVVDEAAQCQRQCATRSTHRVTSRVTMALRRRQPVQRKAHALEHRVGEDDAEVAPAVAPEDLKWRGELVADADCATSARGQAAHSTRLDSSRSCSCRWDSLRESARSRLPCAHPSSRRRRPGRTRPPTADRSDLAAAGRPRARPACSSRSRRAALVASVAVSSRSSAPLVRRPPMR